MILIGEKSVSEAKRTRSHVTIHRENSLKALVKVP